MESVQSALIVIDGHGEEFMNEVFAIASIGEILTTRPGCMVEVAISNSLHGLPGGSGMSGCASRGTVF
jgi:hypothetical protein